jgi:hypothetical protein
MTIIEGAQIIISERHVHSHESAPQYAVALRGYVNSLRDRAIRENIIPHNIIDQEAHL